MGYAGAGSACSAARSSLRSSSSAGVSARLDRRFKSSGGVAFASSGGGGAEGVALAVVAAVTHETSRTVTAVTHDGPAR